MSGNNCVNFSHKKENMTNSQGWKWDFKIRGRCYIQKTDPIEKSKWSMTKEVIVFIFKMSLNNCTGVAEGIFTSTPRVTVKFNLGQDKTLTLPFEMETSTSHLRERLSQILKVPLQDLNISHDSKFIADSQTLADFAATSCGSIVMTLKTNHHIDVSLLFNQIYGDLPVKDVISVTVAMGKGKEPKHLSVEIIDEKVQKAFIGGYRHRLNGTEYHNASSQTLFLHKHAGMSNKKFERDIQTSPRKISKLEGTPTIVATQTPVSGLHVIEPLHKHVTARNYTSAKEFEEKEKFRHWLFRARLNSSKSEIKERVEAFNNEENEPKSIIAPHATIQEVKDKDEHIKEVATKSFSGVIKTFSNKFLLMKEIKQVMIFERERRKKRGVLEKKMNLNTIKMFCQPYTWTGKNGCNISMETEHHREFSKWQEVYSKFINSELPTTERRQLTALMKDMLEAMGDGDSLRLQDLLVRQLDLIDAGVKGKHLITLQTITEKYFLVFLEEYAQKCFPKINQPSQIKNRIHTCKNCKRAKPESSFQINSRAKTVNQCKSCFWVENLYRCRVDYGVYHHMLRSLQREEEKHHCLYSAAFMLQEEDIYYIVNTIWHGQSILSENKDLANLRLCRFDNAIQWAPWNCFLITHKEMLAHSLVDNPLEVYGTWLIEQVRTKHLMAQLHFQHLYNNVLKPTQNKTWLTTKNLAYDKTETQTSLK